MYLYEWTAETDRCFFFSHFCIHKAPGEVSFTSTLGKSRTQGLFAPEGQESDHLKPSCLPSVILGSPTSCIWLPACDCCCGLVAVSERKEVETHADSRPPSFFWCEGGARVSERSKEWLKSEEGAALRSPSSSWNWSLNFIFKASLKKLVNQIRHREREHTGSL